MDTNTVGRNSAGGKDILSLSDYLLITKEKKEVDTIITKYSNSA